MQLPTSILLGLRYSQSRKGNAFISFITFFSVAGILLGVMALTLVSSVMNGFEAELKKRILGVIPHVVVQPLTADNDWQTALSSSDNVQDISPFLQTEALVQAPRQLNAVMLQGIDPQQLPQFLQQALVVGSWQDFTNTRYGVVLGRGLAEQLQVSRGQQLRFMLAQGGSYTPVGWLPRQRLFEVVGIVDTGSEVDNLLAVTRLDDLARLLPVSEREPAWRLSLAEPFTAPILAERLSLSPQLRSVTDWRQSQGKLFAAVAMEKAMMWLMLLLIVAVAAFNIVSALVMMVTEKQAEVAILKTLGMTDSQLFMVFAFQGVVNGMVGALLGVLSGVFLSLQLNEVLNVFGLQLASGIALPVDINPLQIITIFACAVGLTLLAVLYPAWRAVKVNPAEILRDE
ncbi:MULTISPECIES: lipoprotein-releasing ABC transporter permease subunit [unclassified Arsukibacterium]|uniref:lipoprotein-releasing ABC transporter permease subunit n=1 Tax=unclassified Arsukibacterium TaxID=2635278 RepID=UPI000C90A18D|nr:MULTISPECIES: lipoprotein-releasing ABC transporter permease subunit [unclassified Arsukibacterium]MAA95014.1 lipoprotein-releasing system transmembrane subunit LolC [Rheinheimera sp.]HAW92107.1 lipoprotein-releasing ABC transporter permease subunit [Candidatus Azambacteria bacterium]|tara:strand:+ start:152957 stop:154156 length:1200 start_codon:yes stop_codon:yes gene_type:complete